MRGRGECMCVYLLLKKKQKMKERGRVTGEIERVLEKNMWWGLME